jgi:hypothetical protein
MPYKYKIEVTQLSNRNNYSGEIQSLSEISSILKQVEKTLLKDEIATISFTYTEINEEKKNLERAKIRKVVEEEFGKMNNERR